jgi:uncharacterized membrane protein YhhN
MPNRILLFLYALLSVLHLTVEELQIEWLILLTKPLLVSLLALWFWRVTMGSPSSFRKFLLLGLVFSVGGDTLLMFVEHGPQLEVFFLLGLGSFLIAQLCYAYALWSFPKVTDGIIFRKSWMVVLFLGYLGWILATLWAGIPAPMRLPVGVYATAIVVMAIAAANLYGRTTTNIFWGFFGGVLLFVLSDTLIALNKFGEPIAGARFAIMFTYLAAQFLIAVYGSRLLLTAKS